jgi:hypothetical protein
MTDERDMSIYRFTVYLAGVHEISDEAADRLFEAGCDDGSPGSRDGLSFVGFSREASSLEGAIRSAIADVARAGFRAERVEIESDDLEELVRIPAA